MDKRVIRIANIIEEGRLGGPQLRITEVARRLAQGTEGLAFFSVDASKLIVETTVIFPKYESVDFQEKLEEYGIPYIRLPLHRLAKSWKHLFQYVFWFLFEIRLLYSVIKNSNFDLVHVSGGAWQFKSVLASRLTGCRVIWHLNDTQMPRLVRLLFHFLKRLPHGYIVAGERVAEYYLMGKPLDQPVFPIPAPVDTGLFRPNTNVPPHYYLAQNGLNIVMVCNINPIKGVEYFLEMAYRLNQCRNNLYFYIIGPHLASQRHYIGKLYSICQELKLNNVFLLGASQNVASLMRESAIYVCTSLAEASPTSVWEAMSTALPVVSTDVGDVGRYITNGENGFIVPTKDIDSLTQAVLRLIDNSDLRLEFGRKSRKLALENFDIKRVAELHLQAYRAVLNC